MSITNSTNVASQSESFNVYIYVGPVVLGALVNASLFGCLVIQTYVYYANFVKDHRAIKALVAVVFAAQIAHLICVSATLWSTAVNAYGDPSKLEVFPVGSDAAILLTGITGTLVELYFAFRLWKLSGQLLLPFLLLTLCLGAQSLSFVITAKAFAMTSVMTFAVDQSALITASLALRAIYDLTTAMCLAWYLRKQRSTAFSRTTSMIDRLVLWTIETGLITSLVALLTMSSFIAMKESNVWVGIYANLASVNSNSLLASLNSRLVFRNMSHDGLQLQSINQSHERHNKSQSIVINVTRSQEISPRKLDELV